MQEVRNNHKALLPAPCTDNNIGMLERMKLMLHPDVLKQTSVMIQDLFEQRKELMYRVEEKENNISSTTSAVTTT